MGAVAVTPATSPTQSIATDTISGGTVGTGTDCSIGKIGTGAAGAAPVPVTASNPLPVQLSQGNAALSSTNPAPVQVADGAGHTMPAGDVAGRAVNVVPTQGGAALSSTNPSPVQVTDGAGHSQPAGDVQARAVQVSAGDGTHATPAGDAAARAIYVAPTQGGAALSSTNPLPTIVTDGAGHTQPTGDAIARAITVQVTDGTNVIGTSANPIPVSQGPNAADLGDAWFTALTDGTNVGVFANANAAAPASQPALIVGLSPNSPIAYPTPSYGQALAAVSGVVKTTSGRLQSFKATNRNGAARYLQLFNSSSAPAANASALDEFYVAPTSMIIIGTDFFSLAGVLFSTGIAWGFSTTSGTYTAATAADCDFSAVYQ